MPPDDHIKLICTAALWINPLVAPRSFFVCARKLAQKHTSLPAAQLGQKMGLKLLRKTLKLAGISYYMIQPLVELYGGCMVVLKVS